MVGPVMESITKNAWSWCGKQIKTCTIAMCGWDETIGPFFFLFLKYGNCVHKNLRRLRCTSRTWRYGLDIFFCFPFSWHLLSPSSLDSCLTKWERRNCRPVVSHNQQFEFSFSTPFIYSTPEETHPWTATESSWSFASKVLKTRVMPGTVER